MHHIYFSTTSYCVFTLSLLIFPVYSEYPFQNTSLSWDARVEDLVYRLTVQEMSMQMARGGCPGQGCAAPAIPRLGIKPYQFDTECLRGVAFIGPATSFPQSVGLAASFSKDVIYKMAEAVSMEARARNNYYTSQGDYGEFKGMSCLAPFINIMRHPLWGRVQEVYGEDPYLSGALAAAYVQGLQGNNSRYVRASSGCKVVDVHSGPEDIPVSRLGFNAQVTERDMRLTYLPNFKACIDAGTFNLMCSYNSINGIPACANKWLLTDVLRGEFGFKGYYISDMGAIENMVKYHKYVNSSIEAAKVAVNAGVNLELSSNGDASYFLQIYNAFSKGMISRDTIMERVKPLFYTRMRLGEFDPPSMNPYSKINMSVVQSDAHKELSIQTATKTFVLLKNTDKALPLLRAVTNLAIVGPMANNTDQLMGNYPPVEAAKDIITPLEGLQPLGVNVHYAAGCPDNHCTVYDADSIKHAAGISDFVIVCLGTGTELETEGKDRADLLLPGNQLQLLKDAVQAAGGVPVILLLFTAGPVDLTWAKSAIGVSAIMQCFFPAQGAGEALRRVMMVGPDGTVQSPAGRSPYTWPASMDQVPPMINYSMEGRTYRFFKGPGPPLYPYGYGLSYTSFKYTFLDISPQVVRGEVNVTICVGLANTGSYDAEEVVQVYIKWLNACVPMPQLQLVAFERILVQANHSHLVKFVIIPDQLKVLHDQKGYILDPGLSCCLSNMFMPNLLNGPIFNEYFENKFRQVKFIAGRIMVYAGGQQPGQETTVPSNVLIDSFVIA